jgi:integrase
MSACWSSNRHLAAPRIGNGRRSHFLCLQKRPSLKTARPHAILTIPELEHVKAAALGTLVSLHSRRAYQNAIDRFIAWYCSEPRLGFNRAIVLRYRSFLESLSLSPATINLHLSAIRRLADEAAESSMLSPEVAIGIRRVKGVKRLGRRIGDWLTSDQAQSLLYSIPQSTPRGKRDAALIGLLLGCGLRRSEAVALRLDQIQLRQGHWVIADLCGKGGRLRTVPVPCWCKALIDRWLRTSGVTEGLVFSRIWKNRTEMSRGISPDVVWTAVRRHAKQIGVDHLAPYDLRRFATALGANSNRFSFSSVTPPSKRQNGTVGAGRSSKMRSTIGSKYR